MEVAKAEDPKHTQNNQETRMKHQRQEKEKTICEAEERNRLNGFTL